MLKRRLMISTFSSMCALIAALLLIGALFAMSSHPAHANKTPGALPSDAEGFAFLNGNWRVHNRRLKEPLSGKEEWIEFEASAKFFTLLDGLVSVEELRDAKGAPFGSAMRTFDRENRTWSDAWVAARDGVLQLPVHGRFEGDTGTWVSPDNFNGQPVLARGVWKRVSASEVTWEQALSRDFGKSWEVNWKMRFERISGKDAAAR